MGMDVYGNSGNYFRANIWQWRAICYAMELAEFDVPADWHCNDGYGLSDQEDCDALSENLAEFLNRWDGTELIVQTNNLAVSKETGCFVDVGTPNSRSPYSVEREHLQEFIEFLQKCNGFEIH